MESIHVELPDKRQEVVVFEVLGEDLSSKARDIFDNERVTFRSPSDNILILRVLNDGMCTSTIR